MDEKELVKLIAVGLAGYYVGLIVSSRNDIKRRKRKQKAMNARPDSDFWKMITTYLNDPSDRRSVEQLVDDWHTNLKFHKIINEQ